MDLQVRQYFVDGYYPLGVKGNNPPWEPSAALVRCFRPILAHLKELNIRSRREQEEFPIQGACLDRVR